MARAVRFDLIADSSKFTRGMRDAQKSSQKFTEHTSQAGKALKAATAAFSVGVVVSQMRNWVAAARDSNKTAAQTAAVLKSTHNAAGLTADQFAKLAGQISKTAAIDDDLVQSGENIIATFCLQEEAQALAKGRGWVSHRDLKAGDEILAYDPADGSVRWEPIDSMHRFQVDGDLIRWQSQQIDVMTTPHHRWWTTGRTTDRSSGAPVSSMQDHKFRTTAEVSGHQFAVMIGGGEPACFAETATLDDDLVELAGWVATEGWFVKAPRSPGAVGVGFSQSQTANPKNVARIRDLVDRLVAKGHRISETQYRAGYNGSILSEWHFAGPLGRIMRSLLPGKKLTVELVEQLTREQAELLLDTLIRSDGHVSARGYRQYIQKDPGQLDVVSILCAMLGIRTTITPSRADNIALKASNYAWGHQVHARPEHYEGIVWCPHLRTGIFLARCNGRTFWTGNTNIHGDVFKKTTQAAVDMTAAMNHGEVTQEGLKGTAILLGKALNDPTKGLSALTRVGVTFTQQQKDQIAGFIKHGQVAKAQGVILAEVNKEFGGSAAAAVTPAKQLAVTWGNMQEVLGNLLIPAIDRGAVILNNLLGVVDRNRTAFGVLFGVLGGGAAIIGTLVVAEKIHSAVTDGLKAATTAWSAAQKGLNVVLGVTKVQSAEASAAVLSFSYAEGKMVASTTAATAAAGTSGLAGGLSGLLALLGPVGLAVAGVGGAAWVANKQVGQYGLGGGIRNWLLGPLDQWDKANKKTGDSTHASALETAYNAKQQQGLRIQMAQLVPGVDATADATNRAAAAQVAAATKVKDLKGKLQELKDQYKQTFDSVVQSIKGYEGTLTDSKNTSFVTTKSILQDLHNQVANFRTSSHDIHALIKAGFDPAAIKELQDKGPQYVHGLAIGSKAQLRDYKATWLARNKEIKDDFKKSFDEQYAKLVAKMRAMQREINRLKGKTVDVTASTKVDPNVLKVFTAAGGRVRMMARGGRIQAGTGPTADDVLIRASKHETVVSAADSARPDFKAWAAMRGIPGFAAGGAVYSAELGMRNRASGLMVGSAVRAAKLYKQMAGLDIPGGGGGAGATLARQVAMWTVAALHRSLAEVGGWFRRLMFESGGNPRAINRTDSNWLAGHPSVGIAQVIRGTFAANAGRFRGVGPFAYGVSMNPYANSFAGGHYAIGRYGSLSAVDPRTRPIGYDGGGYLPPGLSMAYNGTGRAEPVGAAGVGGPTVVNIYPAPGMSERRVGQMVVEALEARDRKARKGERV